MDLDKQEHITRIEKQIVDVQLDIDKELSALILAKVVVGIVLLVGIVVVIIGG